MRRLIPIAVSLAAFLVLFSCSSIECTQGKVVVCKYELADSLLNDTLSVDVILGNGNDSTLLNRLTGAVDFSIPVSYTQPTDVLMFHFADTLGTCRTDTVRLSKSDIPHFESVDCSPSFFHEIKSVTTTCHVIDSIVILNPSITYEDVTSHLRIHLHPGH